MEERLEKLETEFAKLQKRVLELEEVRSNFSSLGSSVSGVYQTTESVFLQMFRSEEEKNLIRV